MFWSLRDVSSFSVLQRHCPVPYDPSKGFFRANSPVVVTELVESLQICIFKDKQNKVCVTHASGIDQQLVLDLYDRESFARKLSRWVRGAERRKNWFWQAALNSGIVGLLQHWPPVGAEIQVFGVVIPDPLTGMYLKGSRLDVLVSRVVINGDTQDYHSFFPHWVPLLYYGDFDEKSILGLAKGKEQVTGREAHPRSGIVIQHLGFSKRTPFYCVVENPEFIETKGQSPHLA